MEIEFHYWITGILAKAAGFDDDEARTVAYAAQFVDDNDEVKPVKDRTTDAVYENLISQTMDPTMPQKSRLGIYPFFHFVPGYPESGDVRRDGKTHPLNTTPDNANARMLFRAAVQSAPQLRLYRLGIAAHALADTWSHQNFVGWEDSFNATRGNIIPDIGHADLLHHPDWVAHRWEDERLANGQIDNNLRFINAAARLFQEFSAAGNRKPDPAVWIAQRNTLFSIFGSSSSGMSNPGAERRTDRYRELPPWNGDAEYHPDAWLRESTEYEWPDPAEDFSQKPAQLFWKPGVAKEDTPWWRFQEAIKEHRAAALDQLRPVFERMGIDLRAH